MTTATAVRPSGHNGLAKPVQTQALGVTVTIRAPNFQTAQFKVIGLTPLVIHKFSGKAKLQIMQTQSEGSKAKGKKVREPKDFEQMYQNARHLSLEGWDGIPAAAFKSAMISACRATDFVMTRAKQAILYVEADGEDATEKGTGLVRIYGTPENDIRPVINDNGSADMRARPMFREWSVVARVKFDADMLSLESLANLLSRAGQQVGVGEGRPGSKNSNGCGWGTFTVEGRV